jgi:ribosomal protein S6--L-glutamate ligase
MKKNKNSLLLDIGWCEWVSFPALKVPAIEAQIVSDSRHSILTIFNYSTFKEGDDLMISFGIHPLQDTGDIEVYSVVPVKTRRLVTFETGDREWCYVIETEMRLGSMKKTIDLTLVDREESRFRLQLAARNIKNLVNFNPQKSYVTGWIGDKFDTLLTANKN